MREYQIFTNCVMDTSDSRITFDEKGVCDHCNTFYNEMLPKWHKDEKGHKALDEKPTNPTSNYAVVGLYFLTIMRYIAKTIKPSHRGELEITTVNQECLKRNNLKYNQDER